MPRPTLIDMSIPASHTAGSTGTNSPFKRIIWSSGEFCIATCSMSWNSFLVPSARFLAITSTCPAPAWAVSAAAVADVFWSISALTPMLILEIPVFSSTSISRYCNAGNVDPATKGTVNGLTEPICSLRIIAPTSLFKTSSICTISSSTSRRGELVRATLSKMPRSTLVVVSWSCNTNSANERP